MANTTYFGWETPDDTDLVKDGAAAIRTLGQAIDTSMQDLEGGTTGQILSKNSNADMDFVWVTNDVGDITEVVASTPLTGGGSSGSVTVGIQDGTTAQKGAVQLEDSTSSTSTTKASTPNSVKSAYDLANAAIPKSLVDAAGDLIYATANDTPARLALGTAGQVLQVNSGATAPEWATASGGGGMTLLNTGGTALSSTTTTINITTTGYSKLEIYLVNVYASADVVLAMRLNGDSGNNYSYSNVRTPGTSTPTTEAALASSRIRIGIAGSSNNFDTRAMAYVQISRPAATENRVINYFCRGRDTSQQVGDVGSAAYNSTTAISSVTFNTDSVNTFSGGTVYIYGVK